MSHRAIYLIFIGVIIAIILSGAATSVIIIPEVLGSLTSLVNLIATLLTSRWFFSLEEELINDDTENRTWDDHFLESL